MSRDVPFLKDSVLCSACTILQNHQQWMKVPVAPALHQHLALSLFWVLPILIDVYLIIVQICISLMIYDVKHLVMFTTCVHFCEAAINVSLAHIFIRLIVFVHLSFKRYLYVSDDNPLSAVSLEKFFSQSALSSFSWHCLSQKRIVLSLMKSSLSIILPWIMFLVSCIKSHHHTQSHLDFLLCYALGVLYFCILHLCLLFIVT